MDQMATKQPGYSFHIVNIECMPSSSHFNIVMRLDESIEELLPYLAACLPGCMYVHGSGVVNFMEGGHIIGIYPQQVTITDVSGMEEAVSACSSWFERIAEVRRRKESISPVFESRPRLAVLDILRALPRTNCGVCGSPTCMAFAARLFRREAAIFACEPVVREKVKHEGFFQQLRSAGYEAP